VEKIMLMERDYYAILQVSPDADPLVIEGAYVRLTHKYHPDLNTSPDALVQMKAINEAYDVLSDPAKRAEYDRKRGSGSVAFAADSRWRTLMQILETEASHGCKDDTLLGGVDAYAQTWARQFENDPAEIRTRAASVAAFLKGYAGMSADERARVLSQALARAKNEPIPPYRVTSTASHPSLAAAAPPSRFVWRSKNLLIALALTGLVIGGGIVVLQNFQPTAILSPGFATDRCPQGCITPPPGCQIKGNINPETNEKIYHLPGDEFYDSTAIIPSTGERWFCLEEEAVANGWRHARK
jgi:curved DNA-binding protein CbpA